MPKLTNKSNLPPALVRAIENDGYFKGHSDYSTTQLSTPSRIIALAEKHADEIEEDVADRIYSLIGQLGHAILERAGTADIIEKRLYAPIAGKILSGQVDVVDGNVLEDWKFTSIWTSNHGVKSEWIAQASVNAWLCAQNGIEIKSSRYIAIYRDWSATKASRERDYPARQVESFDIPLWSLEYTEAWIKDRIRSHEDAKNVRLPICSKEDRWARGAKVAVMKKGRKTAVKLCNSQQEAEEYIAANEVKANELFTENRPGESIRCQFYCRVAPFCEIWKQIQAGAFEEAL